MRRRTEWLGAGCFFSGIPIPTSLAIRARHVGLGFRGSDGDEPNPLLIMMLWTKQFETGSPVFDQQHRLLIDHINRLEDQLHTTNPSREEAEYVVYLLDYLGAYADLHFNGEEKCMESYRCPAHAQNQQEHERFRGFLRDYKRRCETEGFKLELLRNLHAMMGAWITEHILKIDTQLRPCIPPDILGGPGAGPVA
jgi:hemerythrin